MVEDYLEDQVDYEFDVAPESPPKLIMNLHYTAGGEVRTSGSKQLFEQQKNRAGSDEGRETDESRLASRRKQIDYGKNTIGYQKYIKMISKRKRGKEHPWTPNKYQICSKRSWDGQIRKWRKLLHKYDPDSS